MREAPSILAYPLKTSFQGHPLGPVRAPLCTLFAVVGIRIPTANSCRQWLAKVRATGQGQSLSAHGLPAPCLSLVWDREVGKKVVLSDDIHMPRTQVPGSQGPQGPGKNTHTLADPHLTALQGLFVPLCSGGVGSCWGPTPHLALPPSCGSES